jgi:hypothetical protein
LDEGSEAGLRALELEELYKFMDRASYVFMVYVYRSIPSVILEAIADHITQFWNFNFGSPGAVNGVMWEICLTSRKKIDRRVTS